MDDTTGGTPPHHEAGAPEGGEDTTLWLDDGYLLSHGWERAEEPALPDTTSSTSPHGSVGGSSGAPALRPPHAGRIQEGAGRRLLTACAERLPASLRGGRLALTRKGAAALLVVAVVAAALAVVVYWRSRPASVSLGPVGVPDASTLRAPVGGSSQAGRGHRGRSSGVDGAGPSLLASVPASASGFVPGGESVGGGAEAVIVDVEGRVARAGIERLPMGARVVDALAAAGGVLPGTDTSALNLARAVADGDEIVVGAGGPSAAPAGVSGTGSPLVSLNAATVDQLETLPGVGPGIAQRILDWRSEHGRFTSVGQLRQVSGIGSGARFAQLEHRVRL